MSRHIFTPAESRKGGLAVKGRQPPIRCKCGCNRTGFRHWHAYIGHLGLKAFANRYCGGDLKQAARKFNLLGIAATDPCPWNGAFAEAHKAAAEIQQLKGASQP